MPKNGPKAVVKKAEFSQLSPPSQVGFARAPLEVLGEVAVELTVELGKGTFKVKEILEWEPGTVLRLEKAAGEPAEVYVNGYPLGTGEIVVVNDRLACRIRSFNPEAS